ncbi:hypothetical protein Tco_0026168 [Tanacetum coccineum]
MISIWDQMSMPTQWERMGTPTQCDMFWDRMSTPTQCWLWYHRIGRFSLLLTPLYCDDTHEVTPRVSALAGCDRLVSEPMVIEK